MHRKIVPIFIIFTAVCVGKSLSFEEPESTTETDSTNEQGLEKFCEQSCSKPNWEYRINGIVCACWVDDTVDELDAEAMKTAANKQGFIMWIIPKETPIIESNTTEPPNPVKREIPSTFATEESKPDPSTISQSTVDQSTVNQQSTNAQTASILQPQPTNVLTPSTIVNIQETNSRMSDVGDLKEPKKTTLKKYRTTTGTTEKGLLPLQKPDSILGKSLKDKLIPTINRRQGLGRGCSSDGMKVSLQGLKQQASRLSDRLVQNGLSCALVLPELEAMKVTIQQLINRASEKKDGERGNIFEQIKERQAKFHSRLGHFELPKRPGKLNLVGSIHKNHKLGEKTTNKGKIITQPKEFMDDEE